jgi:hypothetical protein
MLGAGKISHDKQCEPRWHGLPSGLGSLLGWFRPGGLLAVLSLLAWEFGRGNMDFFLILGLLAALVSYGLGRAFRYVLSGE